MTVVRFLLALMFCPAFVLLVRGVGARSRALRGVGVLGGVGIASVIINFPSLVDQAASEVGIATAGDLVLYLVVLVLVTLIGYMLGKFRRIEQRLNRLVHEVAVTSEKAESEPPASR